MWETVPRRGNFPPREKPLQRGSTTTRGDSQSQWGKVYPKDRAIAYDLDLLHDSEGLQPNGYDALYRSVTDTSLSLENRQGFSHMRLP